MKILAQSLIVGALSLASALPTPSPVTEIGSFSVPRSPSGLFFDEEASSLLYVLCGTRTNSDHYLYAYTTDGAEQCLITIPQSAGMSRVDGFFITHSDKKAYIVDSQGPMWADSSPDRLGGSVYQVEWDDPCGCNSGSCSSTIVTWSPTVTQQWNLMAMDISDAEGGGNDEYFRNSGIVVVEDSFYGVNGVHPIDGSYTNAYAKSVVKFDMASSAVVESWPFDGSNIGRDVDMEGLTCGPDKCKSSLFIGDEYNYIYELDLASGTVTRDWDLTSIANVPRADKGIEALTYASTTGYFYAGIQDTSQIHIVQLDGMEAGTDQVALPEDAPQAIAEADFDFQTSGTQPEAADTQPQAPSNSLPTPSAFTRVTSFSVPRSPSGLFFDEGVSSLLYVLCGTQTNGDHYMYAYTTRGVEQCLITIPQAAGMSRVDGFYITHDDGKAYIVDSQGPMWADSSPDRLGGSVYQVEWNDPCGCNSGACSSTSVTWTPTVTQQWSLSAMDVSDTEGRGTDEHFRNSGIVVVGDHFYGVNGVHPIDGSLTTAYAKSVIKFDMASSQIVESWPFDGSTVGRDVDMEGMTCGPDQCASSIFIGDEYNYIYELDLESGIIIRDWDLTGIVGFDRADKGVEALTYASTTGFFYAGIQETAEVHVLELTHDEVDPASIAADTNNSSLDANVVVAVAPKGPPTTLSQCDVTDGFQTCSAPTVPLSEKRIRREIRSLSMDEWDRVVAAMWTMKTTDIATGKATYGDAYRPYDYFVVKHATATTDTRGDQAHFGAHFMTWHLAFVLEFENALLAVDPRIGAMPYWDECIAEPSVFNADYFGSDPTGFPYEVTDGKFAYWPIDTEFSIADWSPLMANTSTVAYAGSGPDLAFMRGAENTVNTSFATRLGSGSSWENSLPATCTDQWWECTDESKFFWNDWYACVEGSSPQWHGGPHGTIGGSRGRQGGGGGGRPPRPDGQGPPGDRPPRPQGGGGGGGGRPEDGPQERGDFEDPVTSPNGPIFMFHHANLDRSRMWWMQRHNQEEGVCNYYSFPVENADFIARSITIGGNNFPGAHLNEVMSSSWGFTAEDLGVGAFDSNFTETLGQATHADILCWLNPETSPYTYDTNADCLENSTLCNPVQHMDSGDLFIDDAAVISKTGSLDNKEGVNGATSGARSGGTLVSMSLGLMALLM